MTSSPQIRLRCHQLADSGSDSFRHACELASQQHLIYAVHRRARSCIYRKLCVLSSNERKPKTTTDRLTVDTLRRLQQLLCGLILATTLAAPNAEPQVVFHIYLRQGGLRFIRRLVWVQVPRVYSVRHYWQLLRTSGGRWRAPRHLFSVGGLPARVDPSATPPVDIIVSRASSHEAGSWVALKPTTVGCRAAPYSVVQVFTHRRMRR